METKLITHGARVLGVDACKKGWVGLASDLRGYFGPTIDALVRAAEADGAVEVIAIDIPIGLPEDGPRQADVEARLVVRARRSSVFTTPTRESLSAPTHAQATAVNLEATGKGVSQQAYALGRKIFEVEAWERTQPEGRVIEVHPEVSFRVMAGSSLKYPKNTWAGSEERRAILLAQQIVVPAELGDAGRMAGSDDVLDAAAALWTAGRFAAGGATSYPGTPQPVGRGVAAAIWA